ncbi:MULTISPECIES: ABC transporter permease [Fusobacterium]|jgi:putative ABC transport system permease protein|uniref:ABC transporter permease n=1 Tax=Fusobacterium varium ATCC 27725 TaxID=469618 RepID=A0ABM6U0Y9_FUSVA|nr:MULTISPECIES: ABC transporter permease [Fusobacterium]AVQ29931.1 ABC transporter permease [Fusobacterium varium ATCC 27725]EES65220.1 efflux ABC transporter, permease protein [Fusobacterium varium ATCC 27725]MCD7980187.1 ABC transporter permease [Fusobacterium sp.]MCF0170666.1 ABC transporter permease [Fusobacterium varium]MCF2672959.1 ABC transporter permease [Fusobacterium varium]
MNFIESLKSAIQSLKGNKMRSFLTMLGIIIGISSVITMSAIGKGGQENITGNLKEGGYGKFTISVDKQDEEFRWKYLLDDSIIEKIRESGKFKAVSPKISSNFAVKIGERKEMMFLSVTTPDFEEIDKINIVYGRNILPFEYESGEKVITIDQLTARALFTNEKNAVGQTVELSQGRRGNDITYKIVGVYKNPLEQMIKIMGGRRIPRFVRMPLNTYDKLFDLQSGGYTSLIVEGKDPEKLAESMTDAKKLMADITGIEELYEVNAESNAAASFDNILSTLNIFVTFVAGISLFVGGIGVMNIMLVSVIERTKEIGIRKAIGATNGDIMIQFLMESIILTGLGGILGIIIGILLGLGIGFVVKIPPIFSTISIISSLIVSTVIGIVFGVTPAKKAAQLNPVDALRSE